METTRRLSEMTDEGAFERLATAVLRDAKTDSAGVIHTGVNAEGKTVKSPVDGIVFVLGAQPPRMIAAHHTICVRDDLKKKWLHDPSKATSRNGGKPKAPPGDLLKAAEVFSKQRTQMPSLCSMLILTTI